MVLKMGRLIYLTPDTQDAQTILSGLMHVHAHCILHDGTLANFIPPLSEAKLQKYWDDRLEAAGGKSHYIMVYLLPVSTRTTQMEDPIYAATSSEPVQTPSFMIDDIEYEVAGTSSLSLSGAETGPQRAEVQKVFVSPRHRQKGIARILLRELERRARSLDRWSLLFDTTVGTTAEKVYGRLGYSVVGRLVQHGISPIDGRLVDEVTFTKDLRHTPEI